MCPFQLSYDRKYYTELTYNLDGKWYIVGRDDNFQQGIYYSDDNGVSWQKATITGASTGTMDSIAFGNSKFIAVGNSSEERSAEIFTSTDGTSWTKVTGAVFTTNDTLVDVHYADGTWVAVGYNESVPGVATKLVYVSTDGETWSKVDLATALQSGKLHQVDYAAGEWVAVGSVEDGSDTVPQVLVNTTGTGAVFTAANLSATSADEQLQAVAHS